mmetsp:Transcript_23219/g.22779  ORF Transcript_23219/g.22779 Transcript_23219/m.22779 type:complete len:119 (+) Transcript_23219:763-1119(+)
MWPGFRASAFNYHSGLALVVDNVYKFMSTTSVLDRVKEIYGQNKHESGDQYSFQKLVQREFRGKSVISTWGNKRAYIVKDIIFDKNPTTMTFQDSSGQDITVLDYFKKVYNMRITEKF